MEAEKTEAVETRETLGELLRRLNQGKFGDLSGRPKITTSPKLLIRGKDTYFLDQERGSYNLNNGIFPSCRNDGYKAEYIHSLQVMSHTVVSACDLERHCDTYGHSVVILPNGDLVLLLSEINYSRLRSPYA